MRRRVGGNPGEAAVLSEFVKAGFDVLVPFGDGHAYDLVVAIDEWFLRVQCKTAWTTGGCLAFNAYATDHGRGQISYVGRADVFGVYYPPTGTVYAVPVGLVKSECRLRLQPARNNQSRRVRPAADFELDGWSPADLIALVPALGVERPASAVSSPASASPPSTPRTGARSSG